MSIPYEYNGDFFSERSEILFQIIMDFLDVPSEYEPNGDDTFPDFKLELPDGTDCIVEIKGFKDPFMNKYMARQFKRYKTRIEQDYYDTTFYILGMPNYRTKFQLASMFKSDYKCYRFWIDWSGTIHEKGEIDFWKMIFQECHFTEKRKQELVNYIYEEIGKIIRV